MGKKYLIIIIFLITYSFCYSQQSEFEMEVDSVFKVYPNSIYANNYYLICTSSIQYRDLISYTSPLKWQKIDLYKNGFGEVLWKLPQMNSSDHKALTWNDFDWSTIELKPNDSFYCDKINNIPNGKWVYKTNREAYKLSVTGNFKNGLANGPWDSYQLNPINNQVVKHLHENFINGIPHGEWYLEIDGKKLTSYVFSNGKPDGYMYDEYFIANDGRKLEIEYKNGYINGSLRLYYHGQLMKSTNYSNGILNGNYFENQRDRSNNSIFLSKKGSFINGRPAGICEFYDTDAKIKYLSKKVQILNASEAIIIEYDSHGRITDKRNVDFNTYNIFIDRRN